MENADIKIFTSIKSDFYRRKMIMGMFFALSGLFVISYGSKLVTPDNLLMIGLPILILGGFLIMIGLGPIMKLNRLKTHPHELILTKNHIYYIVNGTQKAAIPLECVKKIHYVEDDQRYGIAIDEQFFPYFERRQFSRLARIKSPPE